MSLTVLNTAIVGCGQIADAHLQEVARLPGVHVVAVCDLNPHMAEQAATRFGVPRAYTDLDAMLGEMRPDVVHITTPPASHAPIARTAIVRGAHLYIEKPFTVTREEAEDLVGAAERLDRLVCIGHSYLFDDVFRRVRDLCRRGRLGDVVHVQITMGYDLRGPFGSVFMRDPTHWIHRLPGGVAQNNLSHPVSMALSLLPDPVLQVDARGFRRRADVYGDQRDTFLDELRIELQGAHSTASIIFSCSIRPVGLHVVVRGTHRTVQASFDSGTIQVMDTPAWRGPLRQLQGARAASGQARAEYRRLIGRVLRNQAGYFAGMRELLASFYQAVRGQGPLPIPMDEAVRTAAILDDIVARSSESVSYASA